MPHARDPDTVAQYTIVTPAPGKAVIPSARIIIDLGDWEAAAAGQYPGRSPARPGGL